MSTLLSGKQQTPVLQFFYFCGKGQPQETQLVPFFAVICFPLLQEKSTHYCCVIPRTFIVSGSVLLQKKGAHEQWQQLQRQHIMALINKTWPFALPPLKGAIHYDPEEFHENYKILMEKMVRLVVSQLSVLWSKLNDSNCGCSFRKRGKVLNDTRKCKFMIVQRKHFSF